jgi:hypothetical protein
MRYYFHILKDRERLRDPDGEEFPSPAGAREEATQCARDLIAEELRCGRAAPFGWRIQIAQEDETILETVPFAPILRGEKVQCFQPRPRSVGKHHEELIARALAISDKARTTHAEITRHILVLRDNLQSLAELTRAFAGMSRTL